MSIGGLAGDYVSKNKVLIRYIRDYNGYKIGAAVAIGRGRVGWSLVHTNDYEYQLMSTPMGIPAVERMLKALDEDIYKTSPSDVAKTIFELPAFRQYVENGGLVKKPLFDRQIAIDFALDRALKQDETDTEDLPLNGDLQWVIADLLSRSYKYYKEEKSE